MEPNHNELAPPTELPHFEGEASAQVVEQNAAAPEIRGATSPQTAVPALSSAPTTPTPLVDPLQPTAPQSTPSPVTAQLMADDADLIEKEWVMRAKAIVAETKDDPYLQNKEMNKIKADYLKKRYNKDLKITET